MIRPPSATAMTEEIHQAMNECAINLAEGERTLQALMNRDRDGFARASLPLLQSGRDTPGYQRLLKMLARSDQFVSQLCDPDSFSKEESIELAREIVRMEPQLDTRLVQWLPGRNAPLSDPANSATAERVLELLEVVSSGARIVPKLAPLLRDANPRLRAKAALLIGRRVGNSSLAESCLRQQDPRVRANAIESLWGGTASSAGSVLQVAAKDTNNRVAGNALLGLYQLQDPNAVGQILAMAADPRRLFRATAAWTMGQTSDPRFLPSLNKLARDLYASVRKNATKSRDSIQDLTNTETSLQLQVLRQRGAAHRRRRVSIQALGPEGEPMRGLVPGQFILWEDRNLVTDYEVIEHVNAELLAVGFALCPGAGISGELMQSAEQAVLGCLNLKVSEHHWALAKFVSSREPPAAAGVPAAAQIRPDPRVEPATYLPESGKLENSIVQSAIETHFPSAILAALRSLLPGALKARGNRHLILLTAGEFIPSREIEEESDTAVANKVAIHAVVVGSPQLSLKNLCLRTGGILMPAADGTELAAAFRKLYLALMRQYEIRFYAKSPLKLEVYCEEGHGACHIDDF
jgi:hypothetical protein